MVDWFASVEAHRGEQYQVPPMYSAVKMSGVPLYEMARQGKTVDRKPRLIRISELEVISFKRSASRIRVRCSAGTYIRTLAEDIGKALGCDAYTTELRRTKIADYDINKLPLFEVPE